MVSTFTPNINLEEPARGDDVGVWDTPVNSNMSVIDLVTGGTATISLNNSPVVLSAAQYKARQITFNSTLTGNVVITFPSSFTKSYEIQNLCTGSSAFVIQLASTSAVGAIVSPPPGETIEVFNDGTNIKFKNFGRVGSLMDYAGTAVPNWVLNCSPQPFLNCDGSAFSSVTFPQLAVILGGTTLPDIRGTTRYTLNQATGRITTANAGLDGNTNLALKTTVTQTIALTNVPSITSVNAAQSITVSPNGNPATQVPTDTGGFAATSAGGGANNPLVLGTGAISNTGTFSGANSISVVSAGTNATPFPVIGTGTVVGITMIRTG